MIMVFVSGIIEYIGVGKNVGIEINLYIIMIFSICIWRILFDLFLDFEKLVIRVLLNLIFIM